MGSQRSGTTAEILNFPGKELDLTHISEVSHSLSRSLEIGDTIDHILDALETGLRPQVCGVIAIGRPDRAAFDSCIRGIQPSEEEAFHDLEDVTGRSLRECFFGGRLITWYEQDLTIRPATKGILVAGWEEERRLSRSEHIYLETTRCMASLAIENCLCHKEANKGVVARERARLAQELHDGLAQSIYSMALQIKVCQKLLYKNPETVESKLAQLERLANDDIEEIRRYIARLNDSRLVRDTLVSTLRDYVCRFSSLHGLKGRLQVSGRVVALPSEVADQLYYVTCEGLSNTAKHAKAKNVRVNLEFGLGEIELRIADDGRGFSLASSSPSSMGTSMGLKNIEQRIGSIGGYLQILSQPGCGTQIVVVVPLESRHV